MMDNAERRGYASFLLDYYKLYQNLTIFFVKIMILIKATIFTVTSSYKKVLKLKKVYLAYVEGLFSCNGHPMPSLESPYII